MRICKICEEPKDDGDFRLSKNSQVPGGLYRHICCRECENKKQRHEAHKAPNQRKKWTYHLKRRYGLDEQTYQNLLTTQKGCCAICSKKLRRPHVDHCHKTGKVRGLLCAPCNMYIGHIKEDLDILKQAVHYLQTNQIGSPCGVPTHDLLVENQVS